MEGGPLRVSAVPATVLNTMRLFSLPFHLWVLHLWSWSPFWAVNPVPRPPGAQSAEWTITGQRPMCLMGKAGAQVKGCHAPALSVTSI